VFGLMNFTLLKPLFDVIFEQVSPESLEEFRDQPTFNLSLDYFISLFNHLFLEVSETYGKFGTLLFVCSIIVGSVFLSNLFTYLSGVVLAQVRAQVIKAMRMAIFEKVSGTELKVDYLPPTENDPKQRKPDIRLAWEKLGFKPVIDLETGIQKTMEYFRTFNAI
jgi:hypothetical protein